jgi:endonuclease YncB( thermonuclease family)
VPTAPGIWSGRCVGTTDGDTIRVLHDGREERIRLNAIDAPESHQAFGTKAKQFTSQLVFGQIVTVERVDTDRYGRTVANVYTADGGSVNEALVAAGFAWWYRQYAPGNTRLEPSKRKRGKRAPACGQTPTLRHRGTSGMEARRALRRLLGKVGSRPPATR